MLFELRLSKYILGGVNGFGLSSIICMWISFENALKYKKCIFFFNRINIYLYI